MNSILVLGYLGTQTPVHHHLTLARVCTAIYFGYFVCLPILNLIDLYFFEDKKTKAIELVSELKKTISYYINRVSKLSIKSVHWLLNNFDKIRPTDKTIDYYKIAVQYYFIQGMYI
jgi:hypothetical protein